MSKTRALTLYGPKENPRIKKILIVAKYAEVELAFAPFVFGETNKTPEFLRGNPNGKIPLLEIPGEGFLYESNAIARYIAGLNESKGLLGKTPLQRAQVNQWIDWLMSEVEPAALAWLGPVLGYIEFDDTTHAFAQTRLKAAFDALNNHLETKTFLVGERQTVADIAIASTLVALYQKVIDPAWRAKYSNVNRWFELITQKEAFASIITLTPSTWCTIAQKPSRKKEAPKKEEPKKSEKKEEPKKKEEAKKEEPKKKDKKPAADDEEEEEEVPEEPKKKNPLDELPKSSFVLDEYKRQYSNNPVDSSTEYLKGNFDPEGFSLWFAEYKYSNELTKTFMSANLIGGFYQRMERLRKYAFGILSIYGVDGKHDITGYWIFRGSEISKFLEEECDDIQLYTWTKVNWADFATHERKFKLYLDKADIDGKPFADGKVFK